MESEKKLRISIHFNGEKVASAVFAVFAAFSTVSVFGIIFYILYAAIPAFRQIGFFKFIFSDVWNAQTNQYGILPMIVGSIFLTSLSVLVGGTLAVVTAVWMVYYCPKKLKKAYEQLINLLAGIPSIIYGLFGYTFIVPALTKAFNLAESGTSGTGLLASSIILSIMILPTVTSVAKNSLKNVPSNYYEGALALGCTKNQTVWKVLVPAAKNGILAGLILGIGRAVGETMAVQMLVGGANAYPFSFFTSFSTLTSIIVRDMGYASELQTSALMGSGFVLLVFILILNLLLLLTRRDSMGDNRFFTRRIDESNGIEGQLRSYKRTGSVQDVLWIISWIVALFIAFVLCFIVIFVLVKGLPHLSINFLFGKSSNRQTTLQPAFVSTGLLILLSLAIALPLGIGAAIYLNEYAKKDNTLVKIIRIFIDTLSGIPSIIFGMFGMLFFVTACRLNYSLTAGGITLALMILPTVIRSTEQALSEVPDSMREASYALGAGKLRTVFKVVLPQALSGIVTAIILSIGRIVSESAALIYTAGSSIYTPTGFPSQGSTFAVLIYRFMVEGTHTEEAYATAAILMFVVVVLNILVTLCEWLFKRRNKV